MSTANGGTALRKYLFSSAIATKIANMKSHGILTHSVWDRLVFSKVKAALGGRIRVICSGSAPISPEILDFLRVAFCCDVIEGYGATETAAGLTTNVPKDFSGTGTVGVMNARLDYWI